MTVSSPNYSGLHCTEDKHEAWANCSAQRRKKPFRLQRALILLHCQCVCVRVCLWRPWGTRGTLQLQACRLAGTLKVASSSWRQLLSPWRHVQPMREWVRRRWMEGGVGVYICGFMCVCVYRMCPCCAANGAHIEWQHSSTVLLFL